MAIAVESPGENLALVINSDCMAEACVDLDYFVLTDDLSILIKVFDFLGRELVLGIPDAYLTRGVLAPRIQSP